MGQRSASSISSAASDSKRRARISVRLLTALLLLSIFFASTFGVQSPYYATPTASAQIPSYWPMFQHDAQHTSRSPYIASTDNSVRWIFGMGGVYRFSPVIDGNGTIYAIGSGNLYAVNPDGSLRW